jgi:hypothetical protein
MRFMVLVKASKNSEAGALPSRQMIKDMGKFNEELAKSGMMLAGEGLQASSKGARIRFSGGKPTLTQGPFPDAENLVAGFWIVEAKSKDEVIQRFLRAPAPHEGGAGELEIRQVFEASDFPPEIFPPEEAAREQALRDQQQKSARR